MGDTMDQLYSTYFSDVYRFLFSLCHNHHTAEDLVQETFFRAHLHIEDYQSKTVKAWLFTVAYRSYIDYYRKQKRVSIKGQGFFSQLFDKKRTVEETVVVQEEMKELIQAVNALPEKHKMAVLLCDFNQLTYQEAAEVMEVNVTYVKVLLFRGRQALRTGKEKEI